MKIILIAISLILIVPFIFVSCQGTFGEHDIKAEDFITQLESDSTAMVLDVRNPSELTGSLGVIDGAVNIPLGNLNDRIAELEKYKTTLIFVICRSGNRSSSATELLLENGFKVKNVWGGMKAYREIVN